MDYFDEEPIFEFTEPQDEDFLDESVDQCLANNCTYHWGLRWMQAQQDVLNAEKAEKQAMLEVKAATTKQDRQAARLKRREKTLMVNAAKNALISLIVQEKESQKQAAVYQRSRNPDKKAEEAKRKTKEEYEQWVKEKRAKGIAKM